MSPSPTPPPPSAASPLAVDLDVLKLGTVADPVERDDVERALYALTQWQKPQYLVDVALDVIDSYALGVRARRVVPARGGHGAVACTRPHLADHVCQTVTVTPADPCRHGCREAVEAHSRLSEELDLEVGEAQAQPEATLDLQQLIETELTGTRAPAPRTSRAGFRNVPAKTPAELLQVPDDAVETLTGAQRAARAVLVAQAQRCSMCEEEKPLAQFYRDRARLTGHASRCKRCANAANAANARARREIPQ